MARLERDFDEAERVERNYGMPSTANVGAGLAALFMRALTEKSLLWFTLVSSMGLWTFAAVEPEPLRLYAAGGFTVGVYLPMLWKRSLSGR